MTDDRFRLIRQHFLALADLPSEQHAAYLEVNCREDASLREELESLLAEQNATFLEDREEVLGHVAENLVAKLPDREIPSQIGNYEIMSLLGEGGMGTVYLAKQENPRRSVALKVIRPGLISSEVQHRFRREAVVLGRLQHPGIAQIYDAGTAEILRNDLAGPEQPFLAMEYIEGQSLMEFAGDRDLNTAQRLQLLAKIADAVEHAHTRGVIHRDLKPGNIMVDKTGQPKILDFGVARATDVDCMTVSMHTDVGQLLGTLAYMSPEQVEGRPDKIDVRSDVYSLGVMLFELLVGELPLKVERLSVPQATRLIQDEEPSTLGRVNSQYRGDIETIVAKALDKDITRRYQSASELAEDIRRHLKNEPILARPASRAYLLKKLMRRHRGLTIGLASTLLVLLIGIVVATGFALKSQNNERLALVERSTARRAVYTAMLTGASSAFHDQDYMGMLEYLNEAPAEYHNWEYRFFKSTTHMRLLENGSLYCNVHIMNDGRVLGTYRKTEKDRLSIRVVELESGLELFRKELPLNSLFKFSADTRVMAAAVPPFTEIAFWNTETAQILQRLEIDQPNDQRFDARLRFDLNSNGSLISIDHLSHWSVVEVSTGRPRFKVALPPPSRAGRRDKFVYRFSPDGTKISQLNHQTNGPMTLRSCDDGKIVHEAIEISVEDRRDCAWRRDSQALAVASRSRGNVELVNLAQPSPQLIAESQNLLHGKDAIGIAFLHDNFLATGHSDQHVRIWNTENGKLAHKFPLPGRIKSLAAYPPKSMLAVGGHDWFLAVDLKYWQGLAFEGHDNYVLRAVFSPDGRFIASGGWDHTIRVWDALTGELLSTLALDNPRHGVDSYNYVKALCFSDDGLQLMAWAGGHYRWNLANGKRLMKGSGVGEPTSWIPENEESSQFYDSLPRNGQFVAGDMSRDGRLIARIENPKSRSVSIVSILDRKTGRVSRLPIDDVDVEVLAIHPEGQTFAVGSQASGLVTIRDTKTGDRIGAVDSPRKEILSLCFSPDGRRLFAGYGSGAIGILDVDHLDFVTQIHGHKSYVHALDLDASGNRLLSASGDATLRVWDTIPPLERRRQASAASKMREELRPRIDQLLQESGDGAEVIKVIRADSTLSKAHHQAALRLLMESK